MSNRSSLFRLLAASALAAAGVLHGAESSRAGLLGARYAGVSYSYVDVADTGYDARNYGFEYNHDLAANLDVRIELDYLRSEGLGGALFSGKHYSFKSATAGVRSFTDWQGAKLYAEAGVGGVWFRAPASIREDSFLWFAGVGAEFSVTERFAVTPYVRYQDPVDFQSGSTWNYGVRANYWCSERVALTAKLDRDDEETMTYQAGVTFRF